MENEIVKREEGLVISKPYVTEKMIKDYLFTSETKLTEKQQAMFVAVAQRFNLDPFKREIYAIPYGKEFSIVTGYQTYIDRADATGKLNGWHCENTEEGAKITIYRKDWEFPFEWETYYEEFDKEYGSWLKMRKFMIKKVAIGQGFRLAFPEELSGMPYLAEEMEGAKPFNKTKEIKKTQNKKSSEGGEKKETEVSTHEISVVDVEEKITNAGKKYYVITAGDEGIYSTFSESIGEDVKALSGTDIKIKVEAKTFNEEKKQYNIIGKEFDIVEN